MVASLAVLSDVHRVLPVLDVVLAEPDIVTADLVVGTGDHAAGAMPVALLDGLPHPVRLEVDGARLRSARRPDGGRELASAGQAGRGCSVQLGPGVVGPSGVHSRTSMHICRFSPASSQAW